MSSCFGGLKATYTPDCPVKGLYIAKNDTNKTIANNTAIPLSSMLIGYFLSVVLRLISLTLRWDKRGLIFGDQHWSVLSPLIMTFWHGDQLMMPWAYRSKAIGRNARELHALVSMHKDGRMAAEALRHLSIHTVNGSSSKGAVRALLEMRKHIASGNHIAITPDGPKGPVAVAKNGAVILSSSSGAPLFPIVIVAESVWQLRSWDKMFIPKPFSRIVVLAAEPYNIKNNLSREELKEECAKLELCLNDLKISAKQILSEL